MNNLVKKDTININNESVDKIVNDSLIDYQNENERLSVKNQFQKEIIDSYRKIQESKVVNIKSSKDIIKMV